MTYWQNVRHVDASLILRQSAQTAWCPLETVMRKPGVGQGPEE
jgi:hypothetical protein